MTPIFAYEQAVLLSRIPPSIDMPHTLCNDYYCGSCAISSLLTDLHNCQFSFFTRRDMRAQFPPDINLCDFLSFYNKRDNTTFKLLARGKTIHRLFERFPEQYI